VAKAEFASTGKDFALFVTDNQTQGRGRNQSRWENRPNGDSLLSTWCFRLEKTPQPILTPLLGLALYESLFVFDSSLPIRLKAPNDLYLNDGKLSGFLVEVEQKGDESMVFVGLGLNADSAPQVDVKTSCLKDAVPKFRKGWSQFLKYLYNQFLISMEKGQQTEIGQDERDDLLEALNAGLPRSEQYTEVSAHCDLTTAQGSVIPWTQL
jgi:biotin-(acetyl-CoA carboxylase) ligase